MTLSLYWSSARKACDVYHRVWVLRATCVRITTRRELTPDTSTTPRGNTRRDCAEKTTADASASAFRPRFYRTTNFQPLCPAAFECSHVRETTGHQHLSS